jgi:hypothetical protein
MRFDLEWLPPISLKDGGDQNLIYTCERSDLPEVPGIYIFGRRHGLSFEALYVGKATSVQGRVREQFKNLPLMKHVEGAKNGERILLVGRFVPHRGQQPDNCLPIIERALIRHYLERDDDLVNVHGTRLRTHEIQSTGAGARHGIPATIVVDQ